MTFLEFFFGQHVWIIASQAHSDNAWKFILNNFDEIEKKQTFTLISSTWNEKSEKNFFVDASSHPWKMHDMQVDCVRVNIVKSKSVSLSD